VDRFHISTRAYQLQTYNRDYDFRWLEQRLLPLGFRLTLPQQTLNTFVVGCFVAAHSS
jgi:thymidylate kinase